MLWPLLLLLTALACGKSGPVTPDGPADDAANDAASVVRPGLVAVEKPALDGLPARRQIETQHEKVATLIDGEEAALAEAYGELGELYHAYSLEAPALDAYANAARLDGASARWPYLRAVLLQRRGELEEAGEAFERVLEIAPEDHSARLRLAELRLTSGDVDGARQLYERVSSSDPDSAMAFFGLGRVAVESDDLDTAARNFERALELQPEAGNLHSVLASLYTRLGEEAKAAAHLEKLGGGAVRMADPRLEQVEARVGGIGPRLEEALAALTGGDYPAAVAAYRRVLELDPRNEAALAGVADGLRLQGELDEAEVAFERLLEAAPQNQAGRVELATLHLERGEVEAAIEQLEQLTEEAPDFARGHFTLGVALGRAERWEQAAASFRQALALTPSNQTARFQLAVVLERAGSLDAALATLERAVAEVPTFVRARQRLGAFYEKKGRLEDAERQFTAVTRIEDAAAEERALAHYQLGRLATAEGLDTEAEAHFEEAVELFPGLWQAHLALGRRLRDQGRHRDAAAAYARAARAAPQLVEARLEEARSLLDAGDFAAARQALESGHAALPRAAELANALARLLATAPPDGVRDGARALDLAQRLLQAIPRPEHAETYVMALAELGRFDEAATRQRQLIERAEEEGRTADLPRLRAHLELYVDGRPVRLGPGGR